MNYNVYKPMRQSFYLIIAMFFLSSCGVKYKSVPYFIDLPQDSILQEQIKNQTILKIQKDDILAITVSSLNPEASAIFNLGNTTSDQVSTGTSLSNGFSVDQGGNIQLPLIGDLKVEGLTTTEARKLIQDKLVVYLKEPVVSLRLSNFKVSVLGDVSKPGVYPVQNERVTISEALSMAGDLNITGLRNNILLIRENQGKREYIRLNMQSKDIFNSSYYYMKNNDVLYVQPSSTKYSSVDPIYRNVSIGLSALSLIILIISRF